jgi:hypothetical protein
MKHLVKKITLETIFSFCDQCGLAAPDLGLDQWVVERLQSLAQNVLKGKAEICAQKVGLIRDKGIMEESLRGEGWRSQSAQALKDHQKEYGSVQVSSVADEAGWDEYLELVTYGGWQERITTREGRAEHRDFLKQTKEEMRVAKDQWETKLAGWKRDFEGRCAKIEQERFEISEQERKLVERAVEKAKAERGMNYMLVRNALMLLKQDYNTVRSFLIN